MRRRRGRVRGPGIGAAVGQEGAVRARGARVLARCCSGATVPGRLVRARCGAWGRGCVARWVLGKAAWRIVGVGRAPSCQRRTRSSSRVKMRSRAAMIIAITEL